MPSITSVADSLPLADDYITPYAGAITGSLLGGAGIPDGFNPDYGQYEIAVDAGVAVIEFDSNGVAPSTATRTDLAYSSPVIRISDTLEVSLLNVERSTDMGSTYSLVPTADYNLVRLSDGSWLFHYLEEVPSTSTGSNSWRFRFTPELLSGLWVDFDYTGIEAGTSELPFNTLAEGVNAAASGATVNIVSGSTAETPTISNPMTLKASGGNVTIGANSN